MLTISVKNFGPIAEGSVDLKPLTIFVGPSNTGKSYMAAAIWAVSQAFQLGGFPFPSGFMPVRRYQGAFHHLRVARDQQPDKAEEAFEALQVLIEHPGRFWDAPSFKVSALPEAAQLTIEQWTRQWLAECRAIATDRLRQTYGGDSEFARNKRTEDFSLTVHRDGPLLNMDIRLTDQGNPMPVFDISNTVAPFPEFLNLEPPLGLESDYNDTLAREILETARESASQTVSEGFPYNSYYLPAARSGIAQGHKVLAAALARQSRRIGLEPISIPTLPGMTTEFLSNLLSLDRRSPYSQTPKELSNAITFIEKDVLHGRIELDYSARLPTAEIAYLPEAPDPGAEKFTLDHTSSMVSELAPLILFLKHLVNPGDLLIIEEPESHLHPAAQLQLARGLVRLVNAGVKVLVTTHSDIIISQINNLLALNQASPELVLDGGFDAEDFLREDQVGAYLFQYSQESTGSTVTPLEIDPDTGIDEDEFAVVFEAIYNESIALQRDRS